MHMNDKLWHGPFCARSAFSYRLSFTQPTFNIVKADMDIRLRTSSYCYITARRSCDNSGETTNIIVKIIKFISLS